jgi:general stress protein 26
MENDFLYNFINQHKYAVLATVSPDLIPESACIGIAVTQELKIIFDTVSDSRKYKNLLLNPNISFVIGWENEKTVQYEGVAKIPKENDLDELLEIYFAKFPDGIDRKRNWKNIAYFSVQPKWIRYSDFNAVNQQIEEFRFND